MGAVGAGGEPRGGTEGDGMILSFASQKEAIARSGESARSVNVGENRILSNVLDRWIMYTDARDISIMPYLAVRGIMEPYLTEVLCGIVKPGNVCVDVGACFGYQSLLLGELTGPTGRVFSYEPNKRVFLMLKHNIELNGMCPRVLPCPDAIGDSEGFGQLATHKRRMGGATLSVNAKASFGDGGEPAQEVPVITLDARLGDRGIAPDVFVISTVGYEPQVWAGMKGLLKAKRKITIVMDFTAKWYAASESFITDIFDEGFAVTRLVDGYMNEPWVEPKQFLHKFKSTLLLTR